MATDDISAAVEELAGLFGLKEGVAWEDYLHLLANKDAQGCVQRIALQLGLPVAIELSYVSKRPLAGHAPAFETEALARTDWTGRPMEGIVAQVAVPKSIPKYGTAALIGYPIRVRVGEECLEYPTTFIWVLAHELSHVLLVCAMHPGKECEYYADIVPLLLGFCDLAREGRKAERATPMGSFAGVCSTTYGYLTDSQFAVAYCKVKSLIESRQRQRSGLLTQVAQVRRKLLNARRKLRRFREFLQHLDARPPQDVRPNEALRIVSFHALNYTDGWETAIARTERTVADADACATALTHYTGEAVERANGFAYGLSRASQDLEQLSTAIEHDLRILRRHVGFLRRALAALSLKREL